MSDMSTPALIITSIICIGLLVLIIHLLNRHTRFHEQGTGTDGRTVSDYGTPVQSLYVSSAVWSLHQATTITNAQGETVYTTRSKLLTLHDRTWIYDANDTEVAYIWRKFFTLHERHFVTMADGTQFQLSNELWHLVKDVTNIEGLGWQLLGNIIGMNFIIQDANGNVLASIGQKVLSIHDKYSLDLYDDSKEAYIVAILVALQHMMRDRSIAASSTSSASSSTN